MVFALFVSWLVIGAVVGFSASKIINLRGDDPMSGIIVSAIGAVIVGFLYYQFRGPVNSGWSTASCIAALIGGVVAMCVWHAIRSKFVSHSGGTVRRSY